jgi:mRNA interferase HicA
VKSSELHRSIQKSGWKHTKTEGSHYIYEKDGKKYPVPYHGAKEIGTGLLRKITKEMGLNKI